MQLGSPRHKGGPVKQEPMVMGNWDTAMFSAIFMKRNSFDFLFASLDGEALTKWDLL